MAAAAPPSDRNADVVVSAEVTSSEWDRYVTEHPDATADHLWGWRRVFADVLGHDSVYLAARRDGRVTGVLPLVLVQSRVFGRSAASVPFLNYGGILADDPASAAALREHATDEARAFGAAHLELRHQRRMFEDLPCRQHKLALVRSLPATVEALWAGTDRKVRNQVRKAQKAGLSAVQGGPELVGSFYDVFAENMRDLGTPVYSSRLFEMALSVCGDRAQVFVVRHGSRTVAGAVAVRLRDTMLVPWASSLRAYRPMCPNMLLYWTMLEQGTASGMRTFDFGRSSPDSGTHQFKLQWGARAAPLAWEYVMLSGQDVPDQGPSNPKFRLAISAWRRLPLGVANRLGPWIARQLP